MARLVDVINKLQLQKTSVVRHMTSVLQPILEKGILDHSIIHRALMEYLSIADQVLQTSYTYSYCYDGPIPVSWIACWLHYCTLFILNQICWKSSAAEVIQQLSGPLLVRVVHTKDGSRIGMLCIKHGSAKVFPDHSGSLIFACVFNPVFPTLLIRLRMVKTYLVLKAYWNLSSQERKKIIKGLKGLVDKTARDKYGNMVWMNVVDISTFHFFSFLVVLLLSQWIF